MGPFLDPELLRVRSSDFERTFQTVQYAMHAMFPAGTRARGANRPLVIETVEWHSEKMFSNCAYAKRVLEAGKASAAVAAVKNSPEFKELAVLTLDALRTSGSPADLELPSMMDLHNTLEQMRINGKELPAAITPAMQAGYKHFACAIEQASHEEQELNRMMIGRFAAEILRDARAALVGGGAVKLCLYGGHDTVITPLMCGLRAKMPGFPQVASTLSFEVYEHEETGSRYVRTFYVEDPERPGDTHHELELPIAPAAELRARETRGAVLYRMEDFVELAEGLAVYPTEWTEKCGTPSRPVK